MDQTHKSRTPSKRDKNEDKSDRQEAPRHLLPERMRAENIICTFLALPPLMQAEQIRQGIDASVAVSICRDLLGLPLPIFLKNLGLPSDGLRRKIAASKRLTSRESDLLARTVFAHQLATEIFQDPKLAKEWLLRKNSLFRDETPLQLLDTQAGYDLVRNHLIRVSYGICV